MAAVYLHNALFSPEPSHSTNTTPGLDPRSIAHGRQMSRISSHSVTTLRTSISEQSHPTEPLLSSAISGSSAYLDLLDRQPTHPNGPSPGWDLGLDLFGDKATTRERKRHWEQRIKKRLKRLSWAKGLLEGLIGSWATYNTVRYFLAFTENPSQVRQSVCLALGTSTTLSLALILAASLITFFSESLLLHYLSTRSLGAIPNILCYFSSFFLLAPAITSFTLLFVWRNSPDPDLRVAGRCHWDIDVMWTTTDDHCNLSHIPSWGAWLAASITRFVVTLLILVIYHIISIIYEDTRRPFRRRRSFLRRQLTSQHPPSDLAVDQTAISNSFHTLSSSEANSSSRLSAALTHPNSRSNLADQARPERMSAEKRSLRSSRSAAAPLSRTTSISHSPSLVRSASLRQMSTLGHTPTSSRSGRLLGGSPESSDDDVTETEAHSRFELHSRPSSFSVSGNSHSLEGSDGPANTSDAELYGFVDRFRSLVGQIALETEEGLDLAPPHSSANYTTTSGYTDTFPPPSYQNDAYSSPYPGYDEFGGRSNPVDERVRVLGEYIRRMPTIESLGSREVGSLTNSSVHHRDGVFGSNRSAHTLSRPPTRTNTLTMTDDGHSQPPSRSNSLTTSAAFSLAGTGGGEPGVMFNEMGELVREPSLSGSRPSTSRSTTASYYTPIATSSSGGMVGIVTVNEHGELVHKPSLSSVATSFHTAGSRSLDSPINMHEDST